MRTTCELRKREITPENSTQLVQQFEQTRYSSEAKVLSELSLERPLTDDELNQFRYACEQIGISLGGN